MLRPFRPHSAVLCLSFFTAVAPTSPLRAQTGPSQQAHKTVQANVGEVALAREEAAVKMFVREYTDAVLNRRVDDVFGPWVHDERVSLNHAGRNGHSSVIGWEKVKARYEGAFSSSPEPNPMEIVHRNHLIRLDGDAAWAQYDQTLTGMHDGEYHERHSREMRSLKKIGGVWKITSLTVLPTLGYGDAAADLAHTLDVAGQQLLRAGKRDEALQLFRIGLAQHPESLDLHFNLGELFAKEGNKAVAMTHYQEALKLSPTSKKVVAAIARLREQQ